MSIRRFALAALASALVIGFPRASMVLYGLSALIGLLTPTGDFADLRFHGFVAVVLTIMAFFGWRGKKRHDENAAAEKARQAFAARRLTGILQVFLDEGGA